MGDDECILHTNPFARMGTNVDMITPRNKTHCHTQGPQRVVAKRAQESKWLVIDTPNFSRIGEEQPYNRSSESINYDYNITIDPC